jgi:hypothetical protein
MLNDSATETPKNEDTTHGDGGGLACANFHRSVRAHAHAHAHAHQHTHTHSKQRPNMETFRHLCMKGGGLCYNAAGSPGVWL